MATQKIEIKANGKFCEILSDTTVADFVRKFGLKPERCLVELNGKVLRFDDFKNQILKNSDIIEVMSLVAGG